MACVRARVAGEPLPTRRPPCFFNPAHGPSTTDIEWAPPGGQPRQVPVCAADADRVAQGAEPDVRTVPQGAGRVPYWQGGPAYSPWAARLLRRLRRLRPAARHPARLAARASAGTAASTAAAPVTAATATAVTAAATPAATGGDSGGDGGGGDGGDGGGCDFGGGGDGGGFDFGGGDFGGSTASGGF